jgi:magnesium-transporting ATPase (P-type)
MIPEGLVLMTSVAFAVGVVRLGRRRCLVQELPAVEVLARVDVLCVDKTGTLTAPGIDLAEIVVPQGDEAQVRAVLGALARVEATPNPTVRAIATAMPAPSGDWLVTGTVPFSSARRLGADPGEELVRHSVFGRVTPQQKREFVAALRRSTSQCPVLRPDLHRPGHRRACPVSRSARHQPTN